MKFLLKSHNEPDKTNPPDSLSESSTQETGSIYGGIASEAISLPQNSAQDINSAQDVKPHSWSPSLQNLLDQPSANFPLRLLIGGMVFFVAFGTWAWFGQVDEVGKAQGRLVPQGDTYKVEPLDLEKVSNITVEEGDKVEAGQVLVELNSELATKEVERLEQMLAAYKTELEQQQALLERVKLEAQTQEKISAAETLAHKSEIALAQEKSATALELLEQQRKDAAAYRTRLDSLEPISALTQERLNQLRLEIDAHERRVRRLTMLGREGAVSEEFIFQAEQARRQTEQQLTQSQLQEMTSAKEQIFQAEQSLRDLESRITQTEGELFSALNEIERLKAQLNQKQAERYKIQLEAQQKIQQLELQITQLQAQIAETENLLVSAQTKLQHKFLTSPVDGIVLSLNLDNVGKVVQPGETIAEIAPENEQLVLTAVVPDKEAGFLEVGMPAQVKLDAYPYQDYGIITGKVISISSDAELNEKLGPVYRVKVSLEKDYITENQKQIKFKAGQTATADIIMRRRRILDILLDPIRQLKQDGINI